MAANPITDYENETTRKVKTLDGTIRVRKIPPSGEAIKALGMRTRRHITGHLAVNPPDIERSIRLLKAKILREMAFMTPAERYEFSEKPIDFVKDKGTRKKYWITCARCGDKVAYLWAQNESLDDWCDLHYVCWHNRESWRGAMAVNVSPIDGKIGIECACGEDTRDFRTARTLPPIQKSLMIDYTMKHRDFGKPTSRYIATL